MLFGNCSDDADTRTHESVVLDLLGVLSQDDNLSGDTKPHIACITLTKEHTSNPNFAAALDTVAGVLLTLFPVPDKAETENAD